MLGKLTGEDEADSSLDFFGADGGALVVGSDLAGLRSSALKDIIDEAVHDGHSLLGDVDFRVALTEDLEDVRRVRLMTRLAALSSGGVGLLNSRLSGSLTGGLLFSFRGHCNGLTFSWVRGWGWAFLLYPSQMAPS